MLPLSEGASSSSDTHVTSRSALPASALSPPYVSRPDIPDLTHGSDNEEEMSLEYREKSLTTGQSGKSKKSKKTATGRGAKKHELETLEELQLRYSLLRESFQKKDRELQMLNSNRTEQDQEIEELRQAVTGLSSRVKWLEEKDGAQDKTVAGSSNRFSVKEQELRDKLQKAEGVKKDLQERLEILQRDLEAEKSYRTAATEALTENCEEISERNRLLTEEFANVQSRCANLEQQLQEAESSGTHFRQLLLEMEAVLSSDDAARSMREGQSVEEDRKRLDWLVRDVYALAQVRPGIRRLFDCTEEMAELADQQTQTEFGNTDMEERIQASPGSGTDTDTYQDYGMDDSPDYQPSSIDESDNESADEPDSEAEMAGDRLFRESGTQTNREVTDSLKSIGTQTEDMVTDLTVATGKTATPAIDIEPCLWTLEHMASPECFFGKPKPEECELAGVIAFLISKPKDKKNRWYYFKERLQSKGISVPAWPEFKQTGEWTEAMVRYAAFRLGKLSGDALLKSDFRDLKPDSAGYFFAFVQNVKGKTESNFRNFPDRLSDNELPPPACGIFNAESSEFSMAHIHFLRWCSQAGNLSTVCIRHCTAVVSPSTLMYRGLTTEYALKIMDKYPPDQHTITYDDETNKTISGKISNMNKDQEGICSRMPVPDDVVDSGGVVVKKGLRRGTGTWTSDCFKILLEESQLAVTLEAAKDKFQVFELIRRSASLKDLDTYKRLLKQAMDYFPGHSLCVRVQGQKKITEEHTYKNLHPIEGTIVGDIPMEPASFLLSCLYFHGFKHFKKEHVYNYSGRMLKLIHEGAVDKDQNPNQDKRLKEIVDQLLVLKMSAYSKDKGASEVLKKIPVLKHWNLTAREVGILRTTLPPVEWANGQKTTGEYVETNRGAAIKLVAATISASRKRALGDEAGPSQPAKKQRSAEEVADPDEAVDSDE